MVIVGNSFNLSLWLRTRVHMWLCEESPQTGHHKTHSGKDTFQRFGYIHISTLKELILQNLPVWPRQIDVITFNYPWERIGLMQFKYNKPGHYSILKNQRFFGVTITIALLLVENNSSHQEIIMNKVQLIIQDI